MRERQLTDREPAPETLLDRLASRTARVGVVGLGYVGLPVSVTFADAGFRVVGVDPDRARVQAIEEGHSYLRDVPDDRVAGARRAGRLRATTSYRRLASADAILVCVPTPLADGIPDLSAIEAAGRSLAKVLAPGTLVILESTTYPGTTEEVLRPLLEASGLRAGEDFLLAFSPERIDPGNPHFGFQEIPKVVGGLTPESTRAAELLYGQVVPKVVTVSGPRQAEMAKLLENIFRHVNIALVNELATYAEDMGVDIWEAIDAAATKPFGYMPFHPGPGWGGHCIPLDPAYLSWRVRRDRAHEVKFVELAHQVNAEMPRHVVERVGYLLNESGKAIRGSRILGIGVAYKAGSEDLRGSPGLKILSMLARRGAEVAYHDPLVSRAHVAGREMRSQPLTAARLRGVDVAIPFVAQHGVDWDLVAREAPLVFDACNALGRRGGHIHRL
ncbi:MAG TPA: nucleotide sugar dehydrogenase [Actinomycetota bacterium]|nr:nucleotide sugar dehydrogenase [Actinomycetota bacterium]